MSLVHWIGAALAAAGVAAAANHHTIAPEIIETRTVNLTQTVTLREIPAGAKQVRLWVPIPSDGAWQRVVDCQVMSAPGMTSAGIASPGSWKMVKQDQGRGQFVYAEINNPKSDSASVVVRCTVQREGVHFALDDFQPTEIQSTLFEDDLDRKAPLMEVDQRIRDMADKACGEERDPARQAMLLLKTVAENEDHYSKDPSKPKCGRGSASDCLDHGGGCCSDMHSLFIALARARGIPARIQYGYRLLDAKAGASFDPGYRCWVEFFIPGAGWVPTDVVAADAAEEANPLRWASLSAARVWLWQGRSFNLTPTDKAGPIHTMICGWAEIDGQPVDPLPAADGTPSRLGRTVQFEILKKDRPRAEVKLPE